MPATSERQRVGRAIRDVAERVAAFEEDDERCDSDSSDTELDSLMHLSGMVFSYRFFGPREYRHHSKGAEFEIFMTQYNDSEFKQCCRMSKGALCALLGKVQEHSCFRGTGSKPQRAVWIQLAVALERLGSYGNAISVGRTARGFQIARGSVVNYTNRVITAVLSLKREHISFLLR